MGFSFKFPGVQLADNNGNLIATVTNSDGSSSLSMDSGGTATTCTNLTGANQAVSATPKDYRGFAIRETAGAAAVVRVWDNASTASGTVIEEIGLTASESAREFYPVGIKTTNGIYVQVVSGTVVGSVRTG